jgi:endonuclease/exonuclease/phosphatase family metal-dependent hydrolase
MRDWNVRLRVLTYNIHRAIGVDRRFRPERIVEIVGHYTPDIVLLQEVDEGAPRSRELDLARELGRALEMPHRAVGHNVSLRKGRYGNATLSRWPIERERNIDLTVGPLKRRGCQHTTITVEGAGSLEVFNLHLGLSARERARQVGLLLGSQEMRSMNRAAACLVGGDFNDWRSLLEPVFVEVFDFRCATRQPGFRTRALRTYPSFSPRGPLDRLYYRGPLRLLDCHTGRLRTARLASDHLPVVADFELSVPQAARMSAPPE